MKDLMPSKKAHIIRFAQRIDVRYLRKGFVTSRKPEFVSCIEFNVIRVLC